MVLKTYASLTKVHFGGNENNMVITEESLCRDIFAW
jgi:hypothetical protein